MDAVAVVAVVDGLRGPLAEPLAALPSPKALDVVVANATTDRGVRGDLESREPSLKHEGRGERWGERLADDTVMGVVVGVVVSGNGSVVVADAVADANRCAPSSSSSSSSSPTSSSSPFSSSSQFSSASRELKVELVCDRRLRLLLLLLLRL